MSELKATPGPFVARYSEAFVDTSGDRGEWTVEAKDGHCIAVVHDDAPRDVVEANAHLIAAAPDLYEAGEAFHTAAFALIENMNGGSLWIPDSDNSEWAKLARAFSAASCAWNRSADKARGEA